MCSWLFQRRCRRGRRDARRGAAARRRGARRGPPPRRRSPRGSRRPRRYGSCFRVDAAAVLIDHRDRQREILHRAQHRTCLRDSLPFGSRLDAPRSGSRILYPASEWKGEPAMCHRHGPPAVSIDHRGRSRRDPPDRLRRDRLQRQSRDRQASARAHQRGAGDRDGQGGRRADPAAARSLRRPRAPGVRGGDRRAAGRRVGAAQPAVDLPRGRRRRGERVRAAGRVHLRHPRHPHPHGRRGGARRACSGTRSATSPRATA